MVVMFNFQGNTVKEREQWNNFKLSTEDYGLQKLLLDIHYGHPRANYITI